jgi:hypothetical protein
MAQEQETTRAAELQKKTEARGRRAAKDGEKKIQIKISGALSSKNKADLMDITQALQLSTAGTNQRISEGPPLPPRKYVHLLRLIVIMGLADAGLFRSTYNSYCTTMSTKFKDLVHCLLRRWRILMCGVG